MQPDSVLALLAKSREPAFARHANAFDTLARCRVMTGVDEPIHLSRKRCNAAEGPRVDHLHEYGRPPSFVRIGASHARESGGQRLDQ